MSASFIISGGEKLSGEVDLQGSKNAAGPIIAATLLTDRICVLRNVPRVRDVFILLQILEKMGSQQEWLDEHTVRIANKDVDPKRLDMTMVARVRLSVLLIAPLVARFGELITASPGGCQLGARPIKTHLDALAVMGVVSEYDEERDRYTLSKEHSDEKMVVLNEFSVTATENVLMFAALRPGITRIELAAAEPHVQDLCYFLQEIGARVSGIGTHSLEVAGIEQQGSGEVEHRIVSDYLEAGTFLVAGIVSRGMLSIRGGDPSHLTSVLKKCDEFGAHIEIDSDGTLHTHPVRRLRAARIQTMPYPGFPTDLQAPFGVLATQAEGASTIFDTLFENRLQYLGELKRMGANADIVDIHRAVVLGPTPLYGVEIKSFDIRSGATLVIAALIAEGESVIRDIDQIDRGYENIEHKFAMLGADIRRVEE